LGHRLIQVGVIGLLEFVEREVEGPNSVEQRRGLSELVFFSSMKRITSSSHRVSSLKR
jgi:hypothetical protein